MKLSKLSSHSIALSITFCSLLSHSVHARDYKVEVIIFENNNSYVATEDNNYEAPKRMSSGSKYWRLEPSLLKNEAIKISKSQNYTVKHHYAWGVESLPYSESANYTFIEKDIKGYVKVYAKQLLFANLDLDFKGFRMNEKRRLKLNEKHFFDHPKFGVLMQVSRITEQKKETTQDSKEVKLETSR